MTLIFNEIKTPAQVSEINSLCASQSVAYNDFQEHILRTTIGYIFVETSLFEKIGQKIVRRDINIISTKNVS